MTAVNKMQKGNEMKVDKRSLTARDYTVDANGVEKIVAICTVKQLVDACVLSEEESIQRLQYWASIDRNDQDGYLSGIGTEGDTPKDVLIGAIGEAWTKSPCQVEKRKIKKEQHDNELIKCDRTGEMVARKDCIVLPASVYSIASLTGMEKSMLGIG